MYVHRPLGHPPHLSPSELRPVGAGGWDGVTGRSGSVCGGEGGGGMVRDVSEPPPTHHTPRGHATPGAGAGRRWRLNLSHSITKPHTTHSTTHQKQPLLLASTACLTYRSREGIEQVSHWRCVMLSACVETVEDLQEEEREGGGGGWEEKGGTLGPQPPSRQGIPDTHSPSSGLDYSGLDNTKPDCRIKMGAGVCAQGPG